MRDGDCSEKIAEVNTAGELNLQLVTDEPKGYNGLLSYGKFFNVKNYFVVAGRGGGRPS